MGKFIHYLLQYEKDAFFRYKRDRQLPPVMTKRTKVEVSHHQRGLQIPTARVHVSETRTVVRCYILFMDTPQEKGGGSWQIESLSGCNLDGYTVTCQHSTCSECSPLFPHVSVTCTASECQFLCRHMYSCDKKCYEFNNGHICKHIHKVHSLVVANSSSSSNVVSQSTMTQVGQPDTEDTEDDPAEIDIAYAESVFSPGQGL